MGILSSIKLFFQTRFNVFLILFIFVIVVFAIFLIRSNLVTKGVEKENIVGNVVLDEKTILGYCPSMHDEAIRISELNANIILEQKSSSADALNSLSEGELDVVLIGRIAKSSEVNNPKEKILSEGYTLVSNEKQFIQKLELKSLRVHTYINKDIAEELISEAEIIYHSDLQKAIDYGIDEVVLIDWMDYSDDMELFVILDGQLKAKEFRIPVLYSANVELETLKV